MLLGVVGYLTSAINGCGIGRGGGRGGGMSPYLTMEEGQSKNVINYYSRSLMTAPDIKQKAYPTEKSEYTKLLIIQIKNDQIFRLTQSKFIIKEIQNRNKSRPTLPPIAVNLRKCTINSELIKSCYL